MTKNITKNDLVVLLSWIKGEDSFAVMQGKTSNFKWNFLLETLTFDLDSEIDVKKLPEFEDIVINACSVYDKVGHVDIDDILKNNPMIDKLKEMIPDFDELQEQIKSETNRLTEFSEVIQKVMRIVDFESETLKKRQKETLETLLEKYIRNEEYMKCVPIKEMLKNL